MLKQVNQFKTGDLFVFKSDQYFDWSGEYHFRFQAYEAVYADAVYFLGVLEKIIREDMPRYASVGEGYVERFGLVIPPGGVWPVWEVLEDAPDKEHCISCAIPLEWASLALRCPKCWRVY